MVTRLVHGDLALPLVATLLLSAAGSAAASEHYGLQPQPVTLASAGPLAFGPDGVLFVGDPQAATIHAIDTKPMRSSGIDADTVNYAVDDLTAALAALGSRGTERVRVVDMAIDPESGALFLSARLGREAALVTLSPEGQPTRVNLDKLTAASHALENPPPDRVTGEGRRASNKRLESITDLAYAEGSLLVSGLSGDSPLSTVRAVGFPFGQPSSAAHLEIFHAAHGRDEDYAAIRSFIPITIDGKPSVLAGFTCTPLVHIPLDSIQPGTKVRGKTVAELGNRNRPLDMIVYESDGETYLLVTNSARGVMKINAATVAGQEGLTEPVRGGGTAGVPFQQIDSLHGIVQLAKLGQSRGVVVMQPEEDGKLTLATIELP